MPEIPTEGQNGAASSAGAAAATLTGAWPFPSTSGSGSAGTVPVAAVGVSQGTAPSPNSWARAARTASAESGASMSAHSVIRTAADGAKRTPATTIWGIKEGSLPAKFTAVRMMGQAQASLVVRASSTARISLPGSAAMSARIFSNTGAQSILMVLIPDWACNRAPPASHVPAKTSKSTEKRGRRIGKAIFPAAFSGAGSGNRTRLASLEGWNFTTKLCPQKPRKVTLV